MRTAPACAGTENPRGGLETCEELRPEQEIDQGTGARLGVRHHGWGEVRCKHMRHSLSVGKDIRSTLRGQSVVILARWQGDVNRFTRS